MKTQRGDNKHLEGGSLRSPTVVTLDIDVASSLGESVRLFLILVVAFHDSEIIRLLTSSLVGSNSAHITLPGPDLGELCCPASPQQSWGWGNLSAESTSIALNFPDGKQREPPSQDDKQRQKSSHLPLPL